MPRKTKPRQIVRLSEMQQPFAVARLRAVDAHGHGEAGEDQDRGIGGAQPDAQRVAAATKAS